MKTQNDQIGVGAGCGDVGNGLIADEWGIAIGLEYRRHNPPTPLWPVRRHGLFPTVLLVTQPLHRGHTLRLLCARPRRHVLRQQQCDLGLWPVLI